MNTNYPTKPKIQNTVYPDIKLTFNQVFQNIHKQLKNKYSNIK